jgi:hypothetical protein
VYDGTGAQKKRENVYMNEIELRARATKVRKEWKRSDTGYIPDHTWYWLKMERYVEDALNMDFEEEGVEFIVRRIDRMDGHVPDGGSRRPAQRGEYNQDGGEVAEELTPKGGEYISMRAKVISEAWAGLADERPDVTEFRQSVLDGRLLSSEEASAIVDAPGDTLDELRVLELRKLGSILANDYYGWDEAGAIWYVLTGKAPRLRPVRIRARGKSPVPYHIPLQYDVTLFVLPWVPAKEVERAYRSAQKQLLKGTPRETGLRILEVVQFGWELFRTRGPMPSWRAWFELWNQAYPDKKFETWRNFRQYFLRGVREAQPQYIRFPQPKLSAEEQEMRAAEEYEIAAVQAKRSLSDRYSEITFG